MSKVQLLLDVVQDLRNLAGSVQAVADTISAHDASVAEEESPKPTKAPPAETSVSFEKVRAFLSEKSFDGKTELVRQLLIKYGSPKLSGIDPKDYEALMAEAREL
jgi:rRNA biogenesis protein rrp5, putative